jgi:spore coat polysaccharide biosynthesis predicted glycosyltransferase SpsG
MANADLAISSNGRTVYELAHMNVPGIVIDQHVREGTHHFACEENGFVNLGLYNPGVTEQEVFRTLSKLIKDPSLRSELYEKTTRHTFAKVDNRGILEIKNLLM